jgi:hypothetical protein
MVLLERIELSTSALPRMRSTTELQQHTISRIPTMGCKKRPMAGARYWLASLLLSRQPFPRSGLPCSAHRGNRWITMANNPHKLTKEERLAAKLRENLRRRKTQARAFEANPHSSEEIGGAEENTADTAGDSASAALPKDGAKS